MRTHSWMVVVLGLAGLASSGCKKTEAPAEPLNVAAAADLSFALKDVGAAFEAKTGQKVRFSFGATGLLAKQISEGAPFDVFAAANVSFVDDVVKSGACLGDTQTVYATGHLVMWSPKGGLAPKAIGDLAKPELKKLAIANPEHAPYGKAAKQALEKGGVWATVQPKTVYAENVQQALQLAQSGNAEAAIVGLSLAVVTPGDYAPIDESLHEPLRQAMVVCKGGASAPSASPRHDAAARQFTAFVASPDGRAIMKKYGFLLPGESLSEAR